MASFDGLAAPNQIDIPFNGNFRAALPRSRHSVPDHCGFQRFTPRCGSNAAVLNQPRVEFPKQSR